MVRILSYIKRSPRKRLVCTNSRANIVGYSYIDWAGDVSDKRSTSGYCVLIGGNLISLKSNKRCEDKY